jgi:hypothetical protein
MNCSLIFKSKRQYIVHLFFLFFSLTIKDKTNISLTIKILHLGQGSFTSKVYRLHDQKNQDNSFNFRFQIGNDRQSKRLLANLGRILLFHIIIITLFFFIKTGIRDFLLDIYSAYKSFVWTAALGLEVSGSNDIVLILPLY